MKIGLLGTEFNSGNRGCGALGYASLEILKKVSQSTSDKIEVYAFLFYLDPIPCTSDTIELKLIRIEPKKISFWNNVRKVFNQCDFVWDFSGGDSFSDIYGMKRFCIYSAIKELAIGSKAKFVMAPQTIGPFESKAAIMWAKHIMKKSEVCFVRDSMSEKYTKDTFGVTPVLTTDVAFSLPYKIGEKIKGKIRLGFNPSGLLWNGTKDFNAKKHLAVEYTTYIEMLFDKVCSDDRYEIYLIPHVFSNDLQSSENDLRACVEIQEKYPSVQIMGDYNTPMEAKSIISTMDIFIGARMHATIAAFSTGVVTIPFSYSRKFEGLYQDLQYPYVLSATRMTTEEAVTKTLQWLEEYEELQQCVNKSKEIVNQKQQVLLDIMRHLIK